METVIRFGKVVSGYPRPPSLGVLKKTGRLEPSPGRGIKYGRSVEPKELLTDFLSLNLGEPEDVLAYLERNGVPTKCVGLDGYPEDYPEIIAFDELAHLARDCVPPERIANLRNGFLRAVGYGADFYTVRELKALQEKMGELARLVSKATANKSVPHRDQLGDISDGVESARLTLKSDFAEVRGKAVRVLILEASTWSDFEVCLHLGILQCLVEGTAVRQCQQCGQWFEMSERRPNRRFCDTTCKTAYFNTKRRRKHEMAAKSPPS